MKLDTGRAKVKMNTGTMRMEVEGNISWCMYEMMRNLHSDELRQYTLDQLIAIHNEKTAANAAAKAKE